MGGSLTATELLSATGLTDSQAMTTTGQQTTTVGQAPAAPAPTELIAQATGEAGAAATSAPPAAEAGQGPSPAVWVLIGLGAVALGGLAVYLIMRNR
jgi:hypothetical protein